VRAATLLWDAPSFMEIVMTCSTSFVNASGASFAAARS